MALQVYDKKYLVEYQDLGLYKGHINQRPPELAGPARLEWTGAPIDYEEFRLAVAFLKWTHDTHKCEAQARFWYNPETHKWKTVVLPQENHGSAHTREVEEENETKEQIISQLMADGFGEAGTIHHHSNMSAFQSGPDKTDELSRSGFHVTIGNMSAKVADFHSRATFKGINYEHEEGMIETGQWIPGMRTKRVKGKGHIAFVPEIAEFWLSLEEDKLPEFPEVWKSYLIEIKRTTTTTHNQWNNNTGGHSYCGYGTHGYGTGRGTGGQRTRTITEVLKDLHKHDTPCYKSTNLTVWLKDPASKFRVNIRLPKAQRDAIEASTKAQGTEEESEQLKLGLPNGPQPLLTVAELRKLNRMSPEEFNAYLKSLRDEGRVDDTQIRADVEEKMQDELAEFRDEFVSDYISELGLEEMFGELQRISSRIVRMIDLSSGNLKSHTCPKKSDFQDLMCVWIHRLCEMMYDMHPEQWEYLQEASKATNPDDFPSFYKMMCDGLEAGMNYGTIEEIYFVDGSVIPMMRSSVEMDNRKMNKDIRR